MVCAPLWQFLPAPCGPHRSFSGNKAALPSAAASGRLRLRAVGAGAVRRVIVCFLSARLGDEKCNPYHTSRGANQIQAWRTTTRQYHQTADTVVTQMDYRISGRTAIHVDECLLPREWVRAPSFLASFSITLWPTCTSYFFIKLCALRLHTYVPLYYRYILLCVYTFT